MENKEDRRKKLVTHDAILDMLRCDPPETVKLVNDLLGTNYDPVTAIVSFDANDLKDLLNTDGEVTGNMETDLRRDLPLSINGDKFLFEAQTTHDEIMLLRLVKYELHGVLQDLANKNMVNQHEVTIPLPQAILIQIDKSDQIPNEYVVKYVLGKEELVQKIPVIKLWEETVQTLSKDGKALLLPFLLNKFKHGFAKNPSDGQLGMEFVEEIKNIDSVIERLLADRKISQKIVIGTDLALKAMIMGLKNEYIAQDNPVREEIEKMLNVSREPYVSAWDQAVEQGRESLKPTIANFKKNIQTLQSNNQTLQSKLQTEQQARQKEQQARLELEKQLKDLQAQLAKAQKKKSRGQDR
ncbi:MAG: hypothetical protein FWG65_13285 [Turicibacter sp.]|nr:hypothetical protein [Turicibacter sp.]